MHDRRDSINRTWRLLAFVAFVGALPLAQARASAGDLVVVEAGGAYKIRSSGPWSSPPAGAVVALPAVVSTGADGAVKLRQDATTISVDANTAIELLQGPQAGQVLERVVQERGNAFYDVAPLGSSRLRVETPYLVAVIKGTQFNVTVTDDEASVALFEGLLRIEAPEVDDVVDLRAGQMARRRSGDPRITVIDLESSAMIPRGDGAATSAGKSDDDNAGSASDDDIVAAVPENNQPDDPAGDVTVDVSSGDGTVEVAASLDAGIGKAGASAGASVSAEELSANVTADAGLDAGVASLDVGADTSLDLGGADAGVDAGVDVGIGDVEVGADVDVNLAAGGSDPVVDVDLDLDGALGDELGGVLDDVLGDDTETDLVDTDPGADAGDDAGDGGGVLDGLLNPLGL